MNSKKYFDKVAVGWDLTEKMSSGGSRRQVRGMWLWTVQMRHAVPNQALERRRPVSAFSWLRVKNMLEPVMKNMFKD